MKMNTIKTLIIAALPISFISCGSSSSSTPGITGYLGDGLIQGAYVCHDDNANLSCLDDTYATTNSDGSFTLSNYDSTKVLLAQIPIGAIDNGPFVNSTAVSQTFTKPVWYYLPANSTKVFISPLSTAVHAIQRQNSSLTLTQAHNIIKVKLGEDENSSLDLMDNYLQGSTQNSKLHAIAEVLNLSMQNNIDVATASLSDDEKHWYSSALIIDNLEDLTSSIPNDLSAFIPATLTSNTSFTSGGYTAQSANLLSHSSLLYVPSDLCSDLQSGYHALEEFNTIFSYQPQYKKLYLDSSNVLQMKSSLYTASAWGLDSNDTTTHNDYLTHIDEHIIDMSIVNTIGDMKVIYDIPIPASRVSCDGASALFDSNGFKYRLFVAGLPMQSVPSLLYTDLGQESSELLTSVTTSYQASDMVYMSAMLKVGDSFVIEESTPSDPSLYQLYQDIGAPSFGTTIPNTDVVQNLLDNNLVIANGNSGLERITKLTSSTVSIQEIASGNTVQRNYSYETYNAYDYLIIHDFQTLNEDLFIGRVNSRDGSNMIYGIVYRSGAYGLVSHPGDMMDDMMLNKSTVDRLLLNNSYPINY